MMHDASQMLALHTTTTLNTKLDCARVLRCTCEVLASISGPHHVEARYCIHQRPVARVPRQPWPTLCRPTAKHRVSRRRG